MHCLFVHRALFQQNNHAQNSLIKQSITFRQTSFAGPRLLVQSTCICTQPQSVYNASGRYEAVQSVLLFSDDYTLHIAQRNGLRCQGYSRNSWTENQSPFLQMYRILYIASWWVHETGSWETIPSCKLEHWTNQGL